MRRYQLSVCLASTCTMIAAIGSLGLLAACETPVGDDDDAPRSQEQLQALLHDDPLTHLPPGSSSRAADTVAGTPHLVPQGDPLAAWSFDDCNPFRTQLFDSVFDNTAFR